MVPTVPALPIRHPFRQSYILNLETHKTLQSTFVSSRFGNTCYEIARVRTNREENAKGDCPDKVYMHSSPRGVPLERLAAGSVR